MSRLERQSNDDALLTKSALFVFVFSVRVPPHPSCELPRLGGYLLADRLSCEEKSSKATAIYLGEVIGKGDKDRLAGSLVRRLGLVRRLAWFFVDLVRRLALLQGSE